STHKDVGPAFREASVEPLLQGLVDFCERVPLVGACSLVLVGRLESRGRGGLAEIARLHGTFPTWAQREIPASAWPALVSSRPYLQVEPDLWLPLHPMAAVAHSGAEWHVGWYARQVQVPTVAYQGAGGHEFQLVLAPDELELFVRGARREGEPAPNAAALALEPFRGLLAYDEEHAAIFFGREEETDAALARLSERSALFVYGASGSGKSSWLRAGIVPALRARAALAGRALTPIVLVPGDRPLASLRRAVADARGGTPEEAARWSREVDATLSRASAAIMQGEHGPDAERALAHLLRGLAALGQTPVLLVDQMEEAATIALDRAEGGAFLALVAGAAASAVEAGAIVLASARADLLPHLIEHPGVRAFLERDGQPIGSIAPERLARVIVEPLRGRRVAVEPGLTETILADVASEPGALALLSQVLTTLWSERARFGGALTKQGYVEAGRVSGALEKQAEAALAEVRSAANGTAVSTSDAATGTDGADRAKSAERRVDRFFRALAQSDAGERFTRRRVDLEALVSELGTSEPELRALARPFVERRLVILGGEGARPAAEVAHERLLDAWPRLRTLLANEREALDLRREIEAACAAWSASGGKSELWSDATSKLRRSEELLAAERLDVDARGRAFLAASRAATTRRKRIERTAIAALCALTLLAAGAAWWAREQTKAAQALTQVLLVRDREARLQGLVSELAYFETLDDDVYAYARKQEEPASAWWIRRARELVHGVPDDPARPEVWRPGLQEAEAELAKLREKALERTPEEAASDRAANARDLDTEPAELEALCLWYARMLRETPWPTAEDVEAEVAALELESDEKRSLAEVRNSEAWARIDPDDRQVGKESGAVLLARRAVENASDAQRGMYRDTLAWALLFTGQLDEALTEGRRAVEEAASWAPDRQDELAANLARMEREVERWRGAGLAERTEDLIRHRASLADVQAKSSTRRTWRFSDSQDEYRHDELVKLVAGLRRVSKQLACAVASVEEESAARAWSEAIEAISKGERYRGTKWPNDKPLTPQIGLVPIGADPQSGLWEFAHLATGKPARRDPASGWIQLDPQMGLVLVLLPGGRVPVASSADQEQDASLTVVDLDPFFVSKYEMTAAQWTRIDGWRRRGHVSAPLQPTSGVSWDDCQIALMRNAGWLRLPTEAQWEYGCRAGTSSSWWTGDDVQELRGVANIRFVNAPFRGSQGVGGLRANDFGLHDVHGNVWEWCADAWVNGTRRAGDGLLDVPDAEYRVYRGGARRGEAEDARSSGRNGYTPDGRGGAYGLRPARGITP
ncbi:MAG: SUMF1/EgtB/PvdO family nonheme iron enzyme, partial [Planctomycetes bacterium]|nr:SUMF1/EgtB/PvdO family nonheme iron enzyme [Planctomycetota bacterium]